MEVENKIYSSFIRRLVLHLFLDKKTPGEATKIICNIYGRNMISEKLCYNWFKRFKNGDFNLEDKKRQITTDFQPQEMSFDNFETSLLEDSTPTSENIAKKLCVDQSLPEMRKIQEEEKKISSELQSANRVSICLSLLNRHKHKSFLYRIVIGGEMCFYYNNPNEPSTARQRTNACVVLCIWWDIHGVLYYELLQSDPIPITKQYTRQLKRLNEKLIEKRSYFAAKRNKVILLHKRMPHFAVETKETLMELQWEVLPYPSCSADIDPSHFYLFRSMKQRLSNQQFRNIEEIHQFVNDFISSKERSSDFYYNGIHLLPEKWQKVINVEKCFEK